MNLTTMVLNKKISNDAAIILEKFSKDQKQQETITSLNGVSRKIKKEVWVGALALGFSSLLESIFSKNEICSASFGHTIRKLQTWFDIETDQEKIFHAVTKLRTVEKVQK